jgi:hypothetical protein
LVVIWGLITPATPIGRVIVSSIITAVEMEDSGWVCNIVEIMSYDAAAADDAEDNSRDRTCKYTSASIIQSMMLVGRIATHLRKMLQKYIAV